MSLATLLNTSASVQNPTRTAVTGGHTLAWAEDATVKCRIQPMSAAERDKWQKDTDVTMATMYVITGTDTDITNGSRVVSKGRTYAVLDKRDFDLQDRLTAVYLEEVED